MALGMKHWAGLVLAGCAFVALRFLPVSSWNLPSHRMPLPEEAHERALRRDVRLTNGKLQRIRLAERLIPLTLAADGPLAFEAPAGADPAEVQMVRADAERELLEAAGAAPRVAVGLIYARSGEGDYPGAPTWTVSDPEYYFGIQDGRPYCVTAVDAWSIRGRVRLPVRNSHTRLGVCQVIARYGLPGRAVETWLAEGGTAMAVTLEPSRPESYTFSSRWGMGFVRRLKFGLMMIGRQPIGAFRSVAQEQCFAGLSEGCAKLFLSPGSELSLHASDEDWSELPEVLAATPLSAVNGYSSMQPADYHVVADLVEEFGAERFERWWTADGSAEEAFRAAFGVPAGEWYAERVARLIEVTGPGPSLRANGLAGAFLILALAAVVGGAWARRRRVA